MISLSSLEKRLIGLLLIVRLVVLCLASLGHLIGDFDESADLLIDIKDPSNGQLIDQLVLKLLMAVARWDSIHSLAIARNGYLIEKQHAFFPLVPYMIRWIGSMIHSIACGCISVLSSHLLAGYILSLVASVVALIALYRLTKLVAHPDGNGSAVSVERFAYLSACFFVVHPANIHLSAIGYTEATYCALTFVGFYLLEKSIDSVLRQWDAVAALAIASASRSNGLVNIIVLVVHFVQRALYSFYARDTKVSKWIGMFAGGFVSSLLALSAQCLVVVTPFLVYSYVASRPFCAPSSSIDDTPSYCHTLFGFTRFYSYIQSEYWNVGLFKYYTVTQIPNFIIALPSWIIATSATYATMAHIISPQAVVSSTARRERSLSKRVAQIVKNIVTGPRSIELKYTVHLAALMVICVSILHVQVSTRFLTASPAMYWQMARLCSADVVHNSATISTDGSTVLRNRRLVIAYCLGFSAIGSLLFGMFLPWT